jgi:hypothetical protein
VASLVGSLALATNAALAAESARQLGAHEHGTGTLNIAIDGTSVALELDVPGADIVGFEHVPKTPVETAAVEKARALMSTPLDLFKLPAAAGCTVKSTEIEAGTPEADEPASANKGVDAKPDAQATKREPHPSAAVEEPHAEYHARYALDCKAPERLTTIEFAYFKAFAGAQRLKVAIITAKAQSSFEATRAKPTLDLGGLM